MTKSSGERKELVLMWVRGSSMLGVVTVATTNGKKERVLSANRRKATQERGNKLVMWAHKSNRQRPDRADGTDDHSWRRHDVE